MTEPLKLELRRTPLLLVVDILVPSCQPGFLSVAFNDVLIDKPTQARGKRTKSVTFVVHSTFQMLAYPVTRNDCIKVPLGDGFGVGGIALDILGQ